MPRRRRVISPGSWPSIAGTVTASTTSVGIQYDIGPILAILTPFNVIGSQGAKIQQFTSAGPMSLLNEFVPPAGYEYSFVAGPGSPDFASIELPIDGSLGLGGDV